MQDSQINACKTRLKNCRKWMRAEGLDALLLTHTPDIRYISGFRGDDSAVLITKRKALILTDGRYSQEVRELGYLTVIETRNRINTVKEVLNDIDVLGVSGDELKFNQVQKIKKVLGSKRVNLITPPLKKQREIKDENEIQAVKDALHIAEIAFTSIYHKLKPGVTEREVAAMLEFEMRHRGADGVAFPTIAAVGTSAAKPHAEPGDAQITDNCCLLIDWGAQLNGYHSDITRMILFGTPPRKLMEVIAVVYDAQNAAIRAAVPGVSLHDVDDAARNSIQRHGYGEAFSHSTGHSVGLEVHEMPLFAPRNPKTESKVLEPGMILTVEPGIYLENEFGVRLEEMILITKEQPLRLSSIPMVFEKK